MVFSLFKSFLKAKSDFLDIILKVAIIFFLYNNFIQVGFDAKKLLKLFIIKL